MLEILEDKIKIYQSLSSFNQSIIPRINLFRYGSRLHVHGRNCFKSVTFRIGSPRSIHSSNFRALRSSCKRGSLEIGMNVLILKKNSKIVS